MLGTGNAFLPYGRYHSFAMIDGKHIIDCPPTALASFRREGHSVSDIETIFITHGLLVQYSLQLLNEYQ